MLLCPSPSQGPYACESDITSRTSQSRTQVADRPRARLIGTSRLYHCPQPSTSRKGRIWMTWIMSVSPEKATGRTKEVYESILAKRGHIANVFIAEGMDPEVLSHQVDLYLE